MIIFKKVEIFLNSKLEYSYLRIVYTLCFLFLCTFLLCSCEVGDCYDAEDYGYGGKITIFANTNQQQSQLLREKPYKSQIARWIDTEYYTVGSKRVNTGDYKSVPVKMKITGKWYPWGNGSKKCELSDCDSKDIVCLNNSNASGLRYKGKVIPSTSKNVPCYFDEGEGLYGLIAEIDSDGIFPNPNADVATSANPDLVNSKLHTFYIPYSKTQEHNIFEIKEIPSCSRASIGEKFSCTYQSSQKNKVVTGRLFFKITDSYYYDNAGSYNITLLDGTYSEGLVSKILRTVKETLVMVQKDLFINIMEQGHVKTILKGILLLYICFTALTYMLGIAGEEPAADIVVRTFKVSIISILLYGYESSYVFFTTYLTSWFDNIGNEFSNILVDSLFAGQEDPDSSLNGFISPTAGYLSMYDQLVSQILSTSINAKVWACLFNGRFIFWFFLLYTMLLMLLIVIIKAIKIYLVAFFQLTLLVILLPIVLIFAVFKKTYKVFSAWFASACSSSFLIILVTAVSGLLLIMINKELADLFYYKVCVRAIWTILDWVILKFWMIENDSQAANALSIILYLRTILIIAVFAVYMDTVPQLADGLAAAISGPSSAFFDKANASMNSFSQAVGESFDKQVDNYRKFRNATFNTKDFSIKKDEQSGKHYVSRSKLSAFVLGGGWLDEKYQAKEGDGKAKRFFKSIGRGVGKFSLDLPVRAVKKLGSYTGKAVDSAQNAAHTFDNMMSEYKHDSSINIDTGLNKKLSSYRKHLADKLKEKDKLYKEEFDALQAKGDMYQKQISKKEKELALKKKSLEQEEKNEVDNEIEQEKE